MTGLRILLMPNFTKPRTCELLRELCAESHSLVLKKLPQYVRKEILKESD